MFWLYMPSLTCVAGGQVLTCGRNQHGQLGVGSRGSHAGLYDSPQLISCLPGLPLVRVATGAHHTLALTLSGALFGWGKNRCDNRLET